MKIFELSDFELAEKFRSKVNSFYQVKLESKTIVNVLKQNNSDFESALDYIIAKKDKLK